MRIDDGSTMYDQACKQMHDPRMAETGKGPDLLQSQCISLLSKLCSGQQPLRIQLGRRANDCPPFLGCCRSRLQLRGVEGGQGLHLRNRRVGGSCMQAPSVSTGSMVQVPWLSDSVCAASRIGPRQAVVTAPCSSRRAANPGGCCVTWTSSLMHSNMHRASISCASPGLHQQLFKLARAQHAGRQEP